MRALVNLINLAYLAATWLIFIRIIFSWIRPSTRDPRFHKIIRLVYNLTEPILEPIRRFLPDLGGLDLSPLVAYILLGFLKELLISLLY